MFVSVYYGLEANGCRMEEHILYSIVCIMELYTFFVCNDQNHNAADLRSLNVDKNSSEELRKYSAKNATCWKKENRDRVMKTIISGGLKTNPIILSGIFLTFLIQFQM